MRIIESLQHPLVKHLVKLRTNSAYRRDCGQLIVIGETLVTEITLRQEATRLLIREGTPFPGHLRTQEMISVSSAIVEKVAGMSTTETMVGEFPIPSSCDVSQSRRLLVLDTVQDPGNVGSLIRSAAALGWDGIMFVEGCADPFSLKVVQASRGCLFVLPFQFATVDNLMEILQKGEHQAVAATIGGQPLASVLGQERVLLILANESRGQREAIASRCMRVEIPMSRSVDSLNVAAAGAILLHAFGPH